MKFTVLIAIILIVSACQKKESSSVTSGSVATSAPRFWPDMRTATYTAKVLDVSTAFTANERTAITQMCDAWEDGVEDKKDFLDCSATTAEITNGAFDLFTVASDSVYGIYKTTAWPVEISTSALAVTQTLYLRHNAGAADEYIEIVKGDIFVNYDTYDFDEVTVTSTAPGPAYGAKYNLRTVILHEIGHFLGADHKPKSYDRTKTIMYPSINSLETKAQPKQIDVADMASKYLITNMSNQYGAGASIISNQAPISYSPSTNPMAGVHITELHADGNCVHKENGVTISRHPAALE